MEQYDIFANGQQLNEHPIEAENKDQLAAFIEIGLQYNLESITILPSTSEKKPIGPNDLTFKKSSSRSFKVLLQGVYVCTVFFFEGKWVYIDNDGIWDEITRTPLKWFKRMPNFNLEF
jgi:hypothetical protein